MKIRREKLHALILSRVKAGEADRRLLLFTRPYGLLPVLAKGVRKIPSRRGGYVEPLTQVVAIVSGTPGHYFLAAVEAVNEYVLLRSDAAAAASAQRLAHTVQKLLPEGDTQESLFDALAQAWELLPELPTAQQHLLEVAVTLHALDCAGWLPNMAACVRCGTTRPTDAVVFMSEIGGWRCLPCHHSLQHTHTSLAPELLRVMRFIATYPSRALALQVSLAQSQQLAATVQNYVAGLVGGTRAGANSPYSFSHFDARS